MARGKEGSGLEKWTHHSVELIRWWSSLLINSKWDGISMFGEKNDGHYVNFLLPNFQHIFFLFSFTFTGLCFYGLKYGYGQKGKGFFLGGGLTKALPKGLSFCKRRFHIATKSLNRPCNYYSSNVCTNGIKCFDALRWIPVTPPYTINAGFRPPA